MLLSKESRGRESLRKAKETREAWQYLPGVMCSPKKGNRKEPSQVEIEGKQAPLLEQEKTAREPSW